MSTLRFKVIVLLVIGCFSPILKADDSWNQFRGPNAGVAEGKNLPSTWDTKKNVYWSVDVPGRGWSSPIISKGKIFLTTVTRKTPYENAKLGLYFGGERAKPVDEEHHWMVLCYDFDSGKKLWEKEVSKGKPDKGVHIKNTYASETPVTDGEHLYAYFGGTGLYCLGFDGNIVWSKEFDRLPTQFSWGSAASPVLYEDKIYIVNDNDKESYLICLNKKNGEQVWKVPRDEKSNWATPYIWKHDDRTEIVTNGTKKIRSYDLRGKLLWELTGNSSITIPTPFARHGMLYIGSGYIMDSKQPLFAIKPGAKGDISLKADQDKNDHVAFRIKGGAPYNPSFLVYEDYLYVLYDRGFLSCFEAKTGKPVYTRERLKGGFTASPWAYDGKIFCVSEEGDCFVIKAGPKFEILGTNKLDELVMASPAIVGDSLFIRTLTKLYRIKEKQ
jgi:outer membrane protein assembly factor BamB